MVNPRPVGNRPNDLNLPPVQPRNPADQAQAAPRLPAAPNPNLAFPVGGIAQQPVRLQVINPVTPDEPNQVMPRVLLLPLQVNQGQHIVPPDQPPSVPLLNDDDAAPRAPLPRAGQQPLDLMRPN